jgi:ectoine hydroxylase-related dioxygenase (phytanoyl-CoA dioxygenase family)
MLNAGQVTKFWDEGFVTATNAVTNNQLAHLKADFQQWVETSRQHTEAFGETCAGRARFDVEPGHSAGQPALRRIASPTELSEHYLNVVKNSALLDMVDALIGPNLRFHHAKVNSKLPGTATTVKWHQDFTFDPHSNDDMVTALLFLDDVTLDNGPLHVVPGTHRGPLLSLWQNGRFTGMVDDETSTQLDKNTVAVTGPAGSVCLMHVRVAHSSAENKSQAARTLFIAAIAAGDAVALSANALPSIHEGMLLKGVEPGRVRSIDFQLQTPELPSGASFFAQQTDKQADTVSEATVATSRARQ